MIHVKASETVDHDFGSFKVVEVVGRGEYHFKSDNDKEMITKLESLFIGSEVGLVDPHGIITGLEYSVYMKCDDDDVIEVLKMV